MVLDLKMPGMDGITTFKEIKKLQLLPAETLILTGHGAIDTAMEAVGSILFYAPHTEKYPGAG